ncbi:hypothetical protein Cpar_1374 [Chlorobaculum parvum NCIB 8327]|uniref:Alpha-L-glutamate ligase-related protein ATP-grasp domain-containing protein n=1 Tax=Chlorobaculum parvum (strain DSM 263 / NCIMB 8327) TaxID=517417 RepID=B3QPC3_CHLP8|nr:ATP-grasp fold amidoligase family protein [Chlorobaculum parvum]ACF11776.1 hypothetical protein Cpar_1374 [Chlorobaculum parvum NCIB 8327]
MSKSKEMDILALKLFSLVINTYLRIRYSRYYRRFRRVVGYHPNVAIPERYHEKMLWRKMFDKNPEFRVFCDKLASKAYTESKCPSLKIPLTLWQTGSVDDIEKMPLSENMVIKANHGSGYNYFPSGAQGDQEELKGMASQWLGKEYGRREHEWGYYGVERKIFAEKLLPNSPDDHFVDMGIRCANGKPILLSVTTNTKRPDQRIGYFDLDGNRVYTPELPRGAIKGLDHNFELPLTSREAIRFAEILSVGVDYARFDFMISQSQVYAGEITVYPAAGMSRASIENQIGPDTICNEHWDLRDSWFLRSRQSGWKALYAKLLRNYLNRKAMLAA